ncbi:peptide-n4-(n-acetyl-beta-glucosaminyl)asparagine amidase a [Moniliophthora roreri MCA 2997]|uniref:Peptide-n4-(N-acetyl-beta-glucosaminyl)asparagine amidase a n=1 Tax=Moniliophthora roreri (strain MCA 2997) TaxID=1381753 RepID=V2XT83_MONRO|nr:peptide-n4-(n-acetyl-beta-glucosaminyl)asparagine amidase a [Moniliophthora roreri MCA 2997]
MRSLLLFAVQLALANLCIGAKLVNFQLTQPPVVPQVVKQCTVQVLQRDFAFSYGSSEVVQLDPPTDCGPPGSWAAITLNFTVTSNGTQYDRLGIFTFRNTEIWRTSTPEPTRGDGIIWTYIKDVSQYIPLFAEPGTFILQLDNLIQEGLDGVYSTVLHATYYASSPAVPPAKKSDLILPISTMANDTGNDASVPPAFSVNIILPRNTVKIYAELFASGNAQEEFWSLNAVNQYFSELPEGTTYPQGPFREVRLLIDGQLAGVAFPYVTVFTGGYAPPLWRPISAYAALDLPTYFLDVTPFVPLLSDGKPHNFSLDVLSAEDDHAINQNWYVSGLLQVVTDHSSKPTTGKMTVYEVEPYAKTTSSGTVGDNGDVEITVKAVRQLHIESTIVSGSGVRTDVVFKQNLAFSNLLRQSTRGTVVSTHNGVVAVSDAFDYPFNVDFKFLSPEWRNWTTYIDHSYNRAVQPSPLILASTIHNQQTANAFFQLQTGGNFGNGTSNNTFSYIDAAGNTYNRRVNAAYNNITLDQESGSLAGEKLYSASLAPPDLQDQVNQVHFAGARVPAGIKVQ